MLPNEKENEKLLALIKYVVMMGEKRGEGCSAAEPISQTAVTYKVHQTLLQLAEGISYDISSSTLTL